MKRKTLSIVVFLLAVLLFGLLFVNHRQEQRQAAHMQQLQKEAMPYEQEINDIRSELAQKQVPSTRKKILPASSLVLFLNRRTILPRSINWLQNIRSPR